VFCFIVLGDKPFLLTMCVLCFILDSTYIAVFHWRLKHPNAVQV
jgi:hypothetical protein